MTELMIDCLKADALTALERKEITIKQYDNRIERLEKMRRDLQCATR